MFVLKYLYILGVSIRGQRESHEYVYLIPDITCGRVFLSIFEDETISKDTLSVALRRGYWSV